MSAFHFSLSEPLFFRSCVRHALAAFHSPTSYNKFSTWCAMKKRVEVYSRPIASQSFSVLLQVFYVTAKIYVWSFWSPLNGELEATTCKPLWLLRRLCSVIGKHIGDFILLCCSNPQRYLPTHRLHDTIDIL